MNKQTVALIHYSAPPVVGGVESVLAHHARLMADHGHAVRVLAARGDPWDERVQFIRLPLIDSRHPRVLAVKAELDAGRVPPDFAALSGDIARALRPALDGVELLVAHNVCSLNKNLALTAALQALSRESDSPPLVLWHHDLAWTTPRYRAELHDGYPWDLLRTHWGGVRHVVVSEFRRSELAALLQIPSDSITVVPNGIETANLLKLEARTQALIASMNLAQAEPLLLLPARLTPRKNIELALRVLAALRRRDVPAGRLPATGDVPLGRLYPRAMLVVTGPEGPHNPANAGYKQRLFALRDELRLRGAAHFAAEGGAEGLPDAVVADLFRFADALILPSREEGFGIPLLEAALARLPVFCAGIPPLRDLGGEDATYFSPHADPESVAGLIADRLRGDAAYRFSARVKGGFTWERIYAAHIAPLLLSFPHQAGKAAGGAA
ncbi:MAG: glycosyltransferase [Chloroflexi bacterium]|nr:glycosyltransferase [Chloroflexota bacterium]